MDESTGEQDLFASPRYLRRLPVYLLLDCSGDMSGEPMVALSQGLQVIYEQLMREPRAVEMVWLSIIRFADFAEQDELIPLTEFLPPPLMAGGRCSLGAALHLLVDSIELDLQAGTTTQKGDYRPLVFLFLSGAATDDWQVELPRLKALQGSQRPTIVALACGADADTATLTAVADTVFQMNEVTADLISGFFRFTSGSVVNLSRAVTGQEAVREQFALPSSLEASVRRINTTRTATASGAQPANGTD